MNSRCALGATERAARRTPPAARRPRRAQVTPDLFTLPTLLSDVWLGDPLLAKSGP